MNSDQLPTLTAEEAEQIVNEADDQYPISTVKEDAERLGFITGATLYKRRSKAERESDWVSVKEQIENEIATLDKERKCWDVGHPERLARTAKANALAWALTLFVPPPTEGTK